MYSDIINNLLTLYKPLRCGISLEWKQDLIRQELVKEAIRQPACFLEKNTLINWHMHSGKFYSIFILIFLLLILFLLLYLCLLKKIFRCSRGFGLCFLWKGFLPMSFINSLILHGLVSSWHTRNYTYALRGEWAVMISPCKTAKMFVVKMCYYTTIQGGKTCINCMSGFVWSLVTTNQLNLYYGFIEP